MSGKDKLKEVAEKLKEETQEQKLDVLKEEPKAICDGADPEFQKLMQADAEAEAEQAGEGLPFLKVYVANRSQSTLADGKDPNNGWFFYAPTKEQYETVHCHILVISKGFRMPGMKDEQGQVKNKWTHIVSGVMLNDDPKPFWLFISGQARVLRLWQFEKQLRSLNHQGTPTFPLLITLSTEKVKTEEMKSPAMVVNFSVDLADNGKPEMVQTMEEYLKLRNEVFMQQKFINQYIGKHAVDEEKIPVAIESEPAVSALPDADTAY